MSSRSDLERSIHESYNTIRQYKLQIQTLDRPEGLVVYGIAKASGLAPSEVQAALETLGQHDVLVEEGGVWRFAVELMRRWLAGHAPGAEVGR